MRLALACSALALALVTACAGDESPGGELEQTLRHFPESTRIMAVLSTDLESEQFRELDRILRRRLGRSVESYAKEAVETDGDLSWEDDVKPQLGRELVVGALGVPGLANGDSGLVVAFHAQDGDKIAGWDRLEPAGEESGTPLFRERDFGQLIAIDGDVLLAAEPERALRAALKGKDDPQRFSQERFDEVFGDVPDDALLRVYGNLSLVLDGPEMRRFRALPWVDALRNAAASLSFKDSRALVDFAVNTEPVDAQELPLATGSEAPEVLDRNGEVVGGNRNQSLTTAFLFRAAEIAAPDSRFVRDVHVLERELGIDFVAEVLRQFNGPSASAVSPDGETFAARSAIQDPESLQRVLPRLAPHLPRLVAGLEAFQSEGQALLFLFAPDVLVLQSPRVRVDRVGDLFRVSGLTGEGPDQLYFGVLGRVFVVASTPQLAQQVASEPTVEVEGARGAGVLRVDLTSASADVRERVGLDLGRVGEVIAWLEASTDRLRGQVSIELP